MITDSMINLRKRELLILFIAAMASTSAFGQKRFTQLNSDVAIANKELADELRSLTWQQADGTWVPDDSDVLRGLARLHTKEGAEEIATSGIARADMGPSLELISLSRYQVFGLVFGDRKRILFDASPKNLDAVRLEDDLWLKQTISVRAQDGGYRYWWALYDVQLGRFVVSNRR